MSKTLQNSAVTDKPVEGRKHSLSYFCLFPGSLCFPLFVPRRQISPAISWIFTKFDYLSFPANYVMMSHTLSHLFHFFWNLTFDLLNQEDSNLCLVIQETPVLLSCAFTMISV